MKRKTVAKILGLAAIMGLAACGEDDTLLVGNDVRDAGDITGDITEDETWTAENEYRLAGRVTVKSGVTLTIEPGTVIQGKKEPLGWLQVERGATIAAEGTAVQPIVFTSAQPIGSRQRGDWGGVVILGSSTNNVGAEVELEGDGGTHGGTNAADSNGTLKYVRIEYAGWELSPDNELNGLTLGSVGSGTTLDYVQVHYGLDDGIEWFGGTANASHLVVSGVGDDCFDTDEGYNGTVQWAVCLQESGEGDNGIEASSNGDNIDAAPRAFPKFANYTFVGRGEYTTGKGNGLKFKEGTAGVATNGVVINFVDGGLDLDDYTDADATNTDGSAVDVENTIFFANNFTAQTVQTEDGDAVFTQFTDDEDEVDEWAYASKEARGNQFVDPVLKSILFRNPDLRPAAGSDALDCAAPAAPFDTSAAYCGAFGTDNWMAGWTEFEDVTPTDVIPVNGFVSENTTWTSDNVYRLDGRVSVEDGVTLTIEAGTTILGSKEPLGWLQVQRGGTLVAKGTASDPIVFTSAQKEGERNRGDWGGLVILGAAKNNVGADVDLEGNGGAHGGTDDADNSGTLEYVRVEFAGWELGPDNELNGITLGSVGSGTTLNHLQVHMGLDDGIEWFGGAADADHLVVSGVKDDCFDTDEGYRGVIQFAVCVQTPGAGDNGIEASNQGSDIDATPVAYPQFANFTFVGNGEYDKGNGIRVKEHTNLVATNGVITGFKSGIDIDDEVTTIHASRDVEIDNVIFYGNVAANQADIGNIKDDTEDEDSPGVVFDEQDYIDNVRSGNDFADPGFTNDSLAALDLTISGTEALACAAPSAPFDTSADYCGAFDGSNNWLAGWTDFGLK